MRRPVFLIFTNAMILLVIFALLAQSLLIVKRLAVADTLSGMVEVQRNGRGDFRALSRGEFLKTGDIVRTGKDGQAEFKWANGTRWKILSNTQLTVKQSTFNVLKRAEQNSLKLTSGKVFVRSIKLLTPTSQFEIETPTAVAAVRGTIFSVEVENGKTKVDVFKGAVNVRQSTLQSNVHKAKTITPGQELVADGRNLHTRANVGSQAEFLRQSSIVLPPLDVKLKAQDDGKVLVQGETEADDVVTINKEPVKVLGNGVFRKLLIPPANGRFVIISTDPHGNRAIVTKSIAAQALAITSKP
jgi:hypothetical protein